MAVLDGSKLATKRRQALAEKVQGRSWGLGIIVANADPATASYIAAKKAAAEDVGIAVTMADLGPQADETAVLTACAEFNRDPAVTGYIVQLPLPEGVSQEKVLAAVDPGKDADGLTPTNLGYLFTKQERIIPATPKGILTLLAETGVTIAGAHITVVGKGLLTGLPAATLLSHRGATVTSCDSQTKDLAAHTSGADIIITAAGKPGLITGNMIKEGAVVIDVGTTKEGGELRGDVVFDEVADKAAWITPVPGGVGPMTVASLLENVAELAEMRVA